MTEIRTVVAWGRGLWVDWHQRGMAEFSEMKMFHFLIVTVVKQVTFAQKKKKASTYTLKVCEFWTSVVAQWLRIRLPMQGTRVRSPVQEDPTCRGATKPVRHNYLYSPQATTTEPVYNYWSPCTLEPTHPNSEPTHHNYWSPHALGPVCCNYWACVLQLVKPICLEPVLHNKRSHQNEKPTHCNEE